MSLVARAFTSAASTGARENFFPNCARSYTVVYLPVHPIVCGNRRSQIGNFAGIAFTVQFSPIQEVALTCELHNRLGTVESSKTCMHFTPNELQKSEPFEENTSELIIMRRYYSAGFIFSSWLTQIAGQAREVQNPIAHLPLFCVSSRVSRSHNL